MEVNINHPNFIAFLDNVTNTINSHVTTNGYFSLPFDKKLGLQYIVFKLLKTSLRIKGKITDEEMQSFIVVLCKKNEESENYELSAILTDIIKNYSSISEKTAPQKQSTKTTKQDETKKK